jgi:hypothetical protein
MNELNDNNYHSKAMGQSYMSVSQFKSFLPQFGGCEARAMAEINGEEETAQTDSMLQGSYVDKWLEGEEAFKKFKAEYEDRLYTATSLKKGQPELYSEFKKCESVIERIQKDEFFMDYLKGSKQEIFTAKIGGVMWKAKTDIVNYELKRIVDLKVMKDMENIWDKENRVYQSFIKSYGYDFQLGMYSMIVKEAKKLDEYFEPFLAVATKESPIDIEIIQFDDFNRALDITETLLKDNLERILEIKNGARKAERCGKCAYCIASKRLFSTKKIII